MPTASLIDFIGRNVFAPPAVLESITQEFSEHTFTKNEYILKEGKISNEYLFLAEGFVRVFTIDLEGVEVTTNFFGTGRVVFDVSSFFMRIPSNENIQAVTDCTAFTLSFEQVNKLFHSIPEFREFGRMMLVKEFAAFKLRTQELINKSAEVRYQQLLETSPEILQHAQLRHIASYLGITDTSLSRIRREFSKKG